MPDLEGKNDARRPRPEERRAGKIRKSEG